MGIIEFQSIAYYKDWILKNKELYSITKKYINEGAKAIDRFVKSYIEIYKFFIFYEKKYKEAKKLNKQFFDDNTIINKLENDEELFNNLPEILGKDKILNQNNFFTTDTKQNLITELSSVKEHLSKNFDRMLLFIFFNKSDITDDEFALEMTIFKEEAEDHIRNLERKISKIIISDE